MARLGDVANRSAWIGALVKRWGLVPDAAAGLAALTELIVDDDHAPTAVRDPLRVIEDHLADSLVALELDAVRNATTIVDLGAGAGFPGLPLALALPGAQVTLIETSARKCGFLRRAVTASGAENATVVNARAEAWAEGRDRHDLVTARAVAPLPVVAEYAAPLLRIGGTLVAWRGRRDADAESSAIVAAHQLGLEAAEARRVIPYRGAMYRHLYTLSKVSATPAGFPRRPGIALKRPLGNAPGGSSDRARR